jgi:hypothetical protein
VPSPEQRKWLADALGVAGGAAAAPAPKPADAKPAPAPSPSPAIAAAPAAAADEVGSLSARYESGGKSSAAIGDDSTGGWSYGKYQIATKTGTMKAFLAYLKTADPDTWKTLDAAGGADAATKHDKKFVKAWEDAAKANQLEGAEHGFVASTHYAPQEEKLKEVGVDISSRSKAIQNVVWSTSVQHGPESELMARVAKKLIARHKASLPKGKNGAAGAAPDDAAIAGQVTDEELINAIYDERGAVIEVDGKKVLKHFENSTQDVQDGVAKRYQAERKAALAILKKETAPSPSPTAPPAASPAAPAKP